MPKLNPDIALQEEQEIANDHMKIEFNIKNNVQFIFIYLIFNQFNINFYSTSVCLGVEIQPKFTKFYSLSVIVVLFSKSLPL